MLPPSPVFGRETSRTLFGDIEDTSYLLFQPIFRLAAAVGLWTLWATPLRVVHKSTGLWFCFFQAIAAMGDHTKLDRAIADDPVALVVFDQADGLADQSVTDVIMWPFHLISPL